MNTAITSTASSNGSVTFDDFGLHPDILRVLAESGYAEPTPIQAAAIPAVIGGRDVMGAAQTGTGKTAGFSLPIIQNLLPAANASASPARHPVRALILTPTRELADQVYDNIARYAKYTALRCTAVFGGVDMQPQTEALRRGTEILVATPGRLLDHVQQRSVNLSQVGMLVLDEADRMLDMGFLPDLQRIIGLLPAQRQTLLFSATFSPEIKRLAASYLRHPQTIEVARSNATAENVRQRIYAVPDHCKQAAVVHLLRQRAEQGLPRQCIIFSNSRIGCSRLARALERQGVNASAIHGDKTQIERMQTLEAFKQGSIDVLVATDVAARGLDISQMPCVINFDLPFNPEDYVHRIGRTGRAGASGDALSLCCPSDEKLLADIEKLIKRTLLREPLADFDPAPAGQPDRAGGIRRACGGDDPRRHSPSVVDHTAARQAFRPSDDPFFSHPYEPAALAGVMEAARPALPPGPSRGGRRPVAALLGGARSKH